MGLGFLSAIVLARFAGPGPYGAYAFAAAGLGLFTTLSLLGQEHIIVRFVPKYLHAGDASAHAALLRAAGRRSTLASGMLALVGIALALVPSSLEWETRSALAVVVIGLPFATLTMLRQAALRAAGRTIWAQIPASVLVPGTIILGMVALHLWIGDAISAAHAAGLNVLGYALAFWLLGFPLRSSRGKALVIGGDDPEWKKMVTPLVVVAIAQHLLSRGDLLLLGYLTDAGEVALFAASSRLSELVQVVFEAVTFVGAPMFSAAVAGSDRVRAQQIARMATRVIFLVSLPLFLVLWFGAPYLLAAFGEQFIQASGALRITATALFLSASAGFVIPILATAGRQQEIAKAVVVFGALNVVLGLVLIPYFGYMGAAWATAVSIVGLTYTLVWRAHRTLGIISFPIAPSAVGDHPAWPGSRSRQQEDLDESP